jgi:ADP-ribose pyrophosphatase YjhB (NUDIX family)
MSPVSSNLFLMTQRYIVFLNERLVTICPENKSVADNKKMVLDFDGKSSLTEAYTTFYRNPEICELVINSGQNFEDACSSFNSLFKHIKAAGGIVRNSAKEVLFIKRLGVWDLPKGKLLKIENSDDGALREVTEETGLNKLRIMKKLPSTFHIYTNRNGKEILKETFWFEMYCDEHQTLVPQLEEDITDVKWFSQTDLDIPVQNTYASLRHLLKGYLNPA